MKAPTERFSTRVENYVKYRPSYPAEVREMLQRECGLRPSSEVADVGSGTGISTAFLLESGAAVYAVEPNAEMRAAAEHALGGNPRFHSVEGQSEATSLADASIDLIVAGQAFHWFDREPTQREFQRILRTDGWLVLIWNERRSEGTPFLEGYERILLECSPEYKLVNHKEAARNDLESFFQNCEMRTATFSNAQSFDWEGLLGRSLSSSYAPEPGDPNHEPMVRALQALYDREAVDGKVDFFYDTQVYYGHL